MKRAAYGAIGVLTRGGDVSMIDFVTAITAPGRTAEFLDAMGDPSTAIADLEQTKRSASVLSAEHPRMIHDYANRWVAVYDGHVVADGPTIEDVLVRVDALGTSIRNHVLVRFISCQPQTLIL